MAERLILETTFLIDLEREAARQAYGPAQSLLERYAQARLYITATVAGELAAGLSLSQRERWEEFVRPFQILPFSKEVAWRYGESYRYLRENGLLIGSNDLWIAATALAHGLPVVTRNGRHYSRVPGLEVISYSR